MLLCRIQLGERGKRSSSVLVWLDGDDAPFSVDPANVRYNPRDFTAERDWRVTNATEPADCPQTGSGWVVCQPADRSRFGLQVEPGKEDTVEVSIPRQHELSLIVRVPKY